jgi:uncharacterized membrane protein
MFLGLIFLILVTAFIALIVRVEKIAGRLTSLEFKIDLIGKSAPSTQPTAIPLVQRIPKPLSEPPQKREEVPQAPPTTPPVPEALPAPPPPSIYPVPAPSRSKEEWEALIGGKLLNRIGAVALIIGVGLFLKYAFENNWITETFRVLLGGAAGIGALVFAARAHRKGYEIFSQGLVGAGIAILYLSVYASFNFYQLVSQPVAFAFMAAVTVIAFTQAFRYDSLAVSLLGWFGGFLTPFLLSVGVPNEVGLFSYLFLLDAGLIAVQRAKDRWHVLKPLTLGGTYVIYFFWFQEYFTPDLLLTTLLFLALFWGLFHGFDLFLLLRARLVPSAIRRLVASANAILAFIALLLAVDSLPDKYLAEASALFGLLYAATALLGRRNRPEETIAFLQYCLTAAISFVFAIWWQFENFSIPIAWTAEAVLMLTLGMKLKLRGLWNAGEMLLLVALVGLFSTFGAFAYEPIGMYTPIWNARSLAFIVMSLGFVAGTVLARRDDQLVHAEVLQYGWIIIALIFVTVEIDDIFRAISLGANEMARTSTSFLRFMAVGAAWCTCGVALLGGARSRFDRPLFYGGVWTFLIGTLLAALRGAAYTPIELFTPILNLRLAALLFVAAMSFLLLRWLQDFRGHTSWAQEFRGLIRITIAAILFILLTGEIRDAFEHAIEGTARSESPDDITRLRNLQQLSLSGGWLVYSIGLMIFGLWRRFRALRIMAIALFGFTILKIFAYDLSFLETVYRFISFLALGVILLAVSYLYQRYRSIITEPSAE